MSTESPAIANLFLASSASAYRRAFVALLVLVVVTFAACLALGCSHQALFPCDAAIHLEGGWRLYQGQRPHTDFYSPLGVVPLLATASGMWLLGPDDRALQFGYTLLFPLVTLWALGAEPATLSGLSRAPLIAAMIGVMLVATRPLNGAYWFATYAMQYNRLGWVLFCLLALTVLIPPVNARSRREEWVDGIAAGLLLALLAFTKVNYVVMGVALVGVALLLFGIGWRLMLGLILGGAAMTLALLAYLRFDVAAMIADLRMLGAVQNPASRISALVEVLQYNAAWLVLLALMILLLNQRQPSEEGARPRLAWVRWWLAGTMLILFGVVICSANSQLLDIPTFGLAALMLAEGFRRRGVVESGLRPYVLASVAGTGLVALILCVDLASIVNSLVWPYREAERTAALPLHSERLSHLMMRQLDEDRKESRSPEDAMLQLPRGKELVFTAYQYAVWFNEGIALIRRHLRPDEDDRLVMFDWINPFTFALGLKSPRGDALWWHYGRVNNLEHHPPPERILSEATLVIVPKRGYQPGDTEFLEKVCGSLLSAHFQKLEETKLWTLYRRKEGK